MKDTEITNAPKVVHEWQHYGHQGDQFNEIGEEYFFPAGCGAKEGWLHFTTCKVAALKKGYKKRIDAFKKVNKKLKAAGVNYHSLLSMLQHLWA